MHSQKNLSYFWARLKKMGFAFVGNCLEQLEVFEILGLHHPKVWTVSFGPG